jgi:hypothetical protein
MISLSLSLKDRRALVIGGGAVAAILVLGRGVPAWYRWQQSTRETARAIVEEARISVRAVKYAAATRDSVAVRRARADAAKPILLAAESHPASVAELTSLLGTLAQESNVRIGSMQVARDSTRPDGARLRHVTVRGEGAGDIAGITAFVFAVETQQPTLVFRQFAVSQSDPAATADKMESLRLEFTIEALAAIQSGPRDSLNRSVRAMAFRGRE